MNIFGKSLVGMLVIGIVFWGTAAFADSSKPGDAFFGIDRAVENLKIAFASSEKKTELKIKFAEERVSEFREIEDGIEDNSSDDQDISDKDRARVELGLQVAISAIEEIQSELGDGHPAQEALSVVIGRLNENIDRLPKKLSIKTDESAESTKNIIKVEIDDNEIKVDSRKGGQRIKIEIEGGKIKIKIKSGDDDDLDQHDEDEDEDDDDEEKYDDDSDEDVDDNESKAENKDDVKMFTVDSFKFAYDITEIRVKKGDKVKIKLTNSDGTHDWVVDEFNAATKRINAGEKAEVEFIVDKTGTFEFYCSVGNHRALGMVGKLIVE